MASPHVRNFASPDELVELETVRAELITIGGLTVSRDISSPGWRWSTHIKPLVGTESCQLRHVGVILRGRLGFILDDGTELEAGPLDLIDIPAGHDAWVVGQEAVEMITWTGVKGFFGSAETFLDRIVATIVFIDVVESTAIAQRLGDRAFADLMAALETRMHEVIERHRGHVVKMTGDGVLATFDGAARAVRCAISMRSAATGLGLTIRVAVHTGEVEPTEDDIRGIAIHEAARMLALARSGEILVSATTTSLVHDAGLSIEDRGEHELRGLSGRRRLFAVSE